MIGTFKLNLLDTFNKTNIVQSIEMMKEIPMSSWLLVQCFDSKPKQSSKSKKIKSESNVHTSSAKKRKKEADTKEPEPSPIAENTGYIVFKDKKL